MLATGRVVGCVQEMPYRWLLRLDDVEAGVILCTMSEANRVAWSVPLPAVGDRVTVHVGYPTKGERILFPLLAVES